MAHRSINHRGIRRGAASLIGAAVLGSVATLAVATSNPTPAPVAPVVAPINAGPDALPAAHVAPAATASASTAVAPAPSKAVAPKHTAAPAPVKAAKPRTVSSVTSHVATSVEDGPADTAPGPVESPATCYEPMYGTTVPVGTVDIYGKCTALGWLGN